MFTKIIKNLLIPGLLCFELNAMSLRDSVESVININPDILSEHFDKKAYRKNIEEEKKDYLPTLDFDIYVEESETKYDLDDNSKNDAGKNGYNANLKFEQVLYDGGLTPNEIEQFKYKYNSIKYTSKDKVEDLILETIFTYNQLVSYQELMALDAFKIDVHKRYLKLAKEKADISGELLDFYQVQSKINAIMDNFLEQEVNQQKALSNYKRLTGQNLNGNICRPIMDESILPSKLEEAIELALRKNNGVRAQEATILEQMARARTEEAKFRPTLKFQMQGQWDNDIAEPENGRRDIYRVRLQSDWNLFNGGKDSIAYEREKVYILKERKKLDVIRNNVIDEIKGSYETYFKIKKRIENMKEFISNNQLIVEIYNKQLEDGSRTFLDLLNAEAELFRTKILLVRTEFSLYEEYFRILKSLNILSDTILKQENQVCGEYVFDDPILKLIESKEKSTEDLESELGL